MTVNQFIIFKQFKNDKILKKKQDFFSCFLLKQKTMSDSDSVKCMYFHKGIKCIFQILVKNKLAIRNKLSGEDNNSNEQPFHEIYLFWYFVHYSELFLIRVLFYFRNCRSVVDPDKQDCSLIDSLTLSFSFSLYAILFVAHMYISFQYINATIGIWVV